MIRRLTSLSFFLLITLSLQAQWSFLGLKNYFIKDLSIYSDTIYASTSNGLYKKHVNSTDTSWSPCGLQGKHVINTLILNEIFFICEVEIDSSNRALIYKTTNGGVSFSLMVNDTSEYFDVHTADIIAHPNNSADTLYFLCHAIKTYDGGLTWLPINYDPAARDLFIKVHPTNPSHVILGGETMILSASLQHSLDYGTSWSSVSTASFFGGDNAIHDMLIKDNEWIASGEGVIALTTDTGKTWSQLLNVWGGGSFNDEYGLYFFDMERSQTNSSGIYVSGYCSYSKCNSRVRLMYSPDNGVTWDTTSYNPQLGLPLYDIRSIKVIKNGTKDKVILAGNGVHVFENNLQSIHGPATNNSGTVVFPNPSSKERKIVLSNPNFEEGSLLIEVLDVLGKSVSQSTLPVLANKAVLEFNPNGIPPGIYFMILSQKGRQYYAKIVLE